MQPARSVTLWRSYQRSVVRNTRPRWGMRGPVLVTFTTSSTLSPTLAVCVPETSTDAVIGSGLEHRPVASRRATSPPSFICLPSADPFNSPLNGLGVFCATCVGRDASNPCIPLFVALAREERGSPRPGSCRDRELHRQRAAGARPQPDRQEEPVAPGQPQPQPRGEPDPKPFAVP